MRVQLLTNVKINGEFRRQGEIVEIKPYRLNELKELVKPVLQKALCKCQVRRKMNRFESIMTVNKKTIKFGLKKHELSYRICQTWGPVGGISKMKRKQLVELVFQKRGY